MIPCKALDDEREKVIQEILDWNDSKEKVLNIISVPYNSSAIFIDIILRYTMIKKKVLFITNEDNNKIELIENIKKHTSFRDYSYIRKNREVKNIRASLFVVNHENALNIMQHFDLVIYDDVTIYTKHRKYEIWDLLAVYLRDGSKVICRSIEAIFQNSPTVDLPAKDCKLPMAEPRLITTRIDVNKEIPYVVYEYLSWSLASEKKIVIFVPDEERADNVYNYLCSFKERLHNNIICYDNEKSKKNITNIIKNKRGIIIAKCHEELDIDLSDTNIMVYFAEDKCFDYKRLVYICGKVGRSASLGNGEVIFLAREITKDMEVAKDIARGFNKQAWDLGLLNL